MAYNLPPSWDPGFVLPDNVADEGLQRRAFVTKQMPRGTYDQPNVGTGGFAVPQYVMDEGYGQGTFTTKWLPSGTYVGPTIPHWLNQRPQVVKERRLPGGGRQVTIQALGDAAMPAPFEAYGQRAAQALLARVGTLPASRRVVALRAMLDKVDRSLWSRTQEILGRYIKEGMSTAQAFPLALARALSTGIAAELIETGLRRSAPQAQSLLGLGCYGCLAALGADEVVPDDITSSKNYQLGLKVAARRAQAAQTTGGVTVKVAGLPFDPYKLTRVWGGLNGTPSPTVASPRAEPDVLIDDPRNIPPETVAFLRDQLLNFPPGTPTRSFASTNAATGFPEWDASPWFGALGIDGSTPMHMNHLWWLRVPLTPFARVKNAIDGSDMALYLSLARRNLALPADVNTNPLVLKAWLAHVPDPSVWTRIWQGAIYLPMTIAGAVLEPVVAPVITPVVQGGIQAVGAIKDAVKDGLNTLGDLACHLLTTPGVGAAAGAVGGTVAGLPPQAGAAAGQTGVTLAQGACGAPPPTPPPVARSSALPLALAAGGAVLVAALFASRRRKATP